MNCILTTPWVFRNLESRVSRFEGEDLRREERLRIQGEQTRAWLEQQIAAKKEEDEEKEKAEQIYMEALVSRDKRAVELAKLEEECNKKLQQSTAEFNRILVVAPFQCPLGANSLRGYLILTECFRQAKKKYEKEAAV